MLNLNTNKNQLREFSQRPSVFFNAGKKTTRGRVRGGVIRCAGGTIVIGLAADSGCGKSTFMRRLTSVFGGAAEPPKGGNPDSNTLISDTTTVICLDDYHSLDRTGRKVEGVTALDPRANNFDLMYEQVKALKDGIAVEKPIYNHVSGLLDPPELIKPPKILVIEDGHGRERTQSERVSKSSNEARKPEFCAYIYDNEGKVLRVKLIMKEGVKYFSPVYLFDEGSTISWIPCGRKLTCSYPGIKFAYGPDSYYDHEVSVLEMDGQFDRLDELIYVESHLSNISTKFYGEITQQMLKHADFPGSNNGTGLFQTIVGLKIRDLFEQITASKPQHQWNYKKLKSEKRKKWVNMLVVSTKPHFPSTDTRARPGWTHGRGKTDIPELQQEDRHPIVPFLWHCLATPVQEHTGGGTLEKSNLD
ncbi:phosphoribulokinase, chloroplastic [Tanacetum coccineum]